MKKFFLLTALLATVSVQAASISIPVAATSATNLLSLTQSGYAKITSVSVAATTATATTVAMYDSSSGAATNVYPATTQLSSYGTNWIQCWTNYYGVQNCWTNISLVQVTNTIAATTNAAPVRATLSAAGNTTTTVTPVSYVFENGVWATNSTAGAAVVTITYQQ